MKLIRAYNWPGNIRELMNCIESAVVMSLTDEITVESLPPFLSLKPMKQSASKTPENLFDIEKKAIFDALNKSGGNKTETAKVLGIGLRTLYRKLSLYGFTE